MMTGLGQLVIEGLLLGIVHLYGATYDLEDQKATSGNKK